MSRLLFWIALAILVVMAIRSKLRAMSAPPAGDVLRRQQELEQGEQMACCAHCHVYFPASESVRADGLDYCSPAHVRLPAQ
jgi:uncharacterized protein